MGNTFLSSTQPFSDNNNNNPQYFNISVNPVVMSNKDVYHPIDLDQRTIT